RAGLSRALVNTKSLAKGIRTLENFARKSLIDDSHFDGRSCIAVVEVAPGEERRSDGLKIAWAQIIQPRDACVLVGTFVDDIAIPGAAAKGNEHGAGGGFHAGDGPDTVGEVPFVFRKALLR